MTMETRASSAVSVVMVGATGAVGNACAAALAARPELRRLTTLGRRPLAGLTGSAIAQHSVDIGDASSYRAHLAGHDVAICTLGVGQPSQVSREEFVRVDKGVPLEFARACKAAGVRHFELLGSVGANARSRSFYLRTKGELEDALIALQFDRLSLFRPSMILTPTNRYGALQALALRVWPRLTPILIGPLRPYRGIRYNVLGQALAMRAGQPGAGVETLHWDDFMR